MVEWGNNSTISPRSRPHETRLWIDGRALSTRRYAPLCVLGQALWERGDLDILRNFDAISMKTCDHRLGEKLLDAFLLILAGYPSLYLLNTKLRPDPMLAQAWHRTTLADQSIVSRTLDAFTPEALAVLQAVNYGYRLEHTQLTTHDWRKHTHHRSGFDAVDQPASVPKRARKGYLGKKTRRDGNWPVYCSIPTMSRSCRNCIRVISTAATAWSQLSRPLKMCCRWPRNAIRRSFGVLTKASAATRTSTGSWTTWLRRPGQRLLQPPFRPVGARGQTLASGSLRQVRGVCAHPGRLCTPAAYILDSLCDTDRLEAYVSAQHPQSTWRRHCTAV